MSTLSVPVLLTLCAIAAGFVDGQPSFILSAAASPSAAAESGEPERLLIPECQLLQGTMSDLCQVGSINELISQTPDRISSCCDLGEQIVENNCYDPCDESVSQEYFPLWNAICTLNVTSECVRTEQQIQPSQDPSQQAGSEEYGLAFRSASTDSLSNLPFEVAGNGEVEQSTGRGTLVLGSGSSDAEDFAAQLSDAISTLSSNLEEAEQLNTVVLGAEGASDNDPEILSNIQNIPDISISLELFRSVPEVVNELNSGKSQSLLVPTDEAWQTFVTQQGTTVDEFRTNQILLKAVLLNHVGWGQQQFGTLDRQENLQLLTLAESVLTVSRSALSGSIVVGGCCDVENTAKVLTTDAFLDAKFAVHVVDRIVLSEAAFEILSDASGASLSPVDLSTVSPGEDSLGSETYGSSTAAESRSPPPIFTDDVNDDYDSQNAPMSLQELRDLVSNLPTTLYVPQTQQPQNTSLSPSPSPLAQNPALTLAQISQQIEDAQPAGTGTLLLGQQLSAQNVADESEEQTLTVPEIEQQRSSQNDTAAQSVLEKLPTGNIFDNSPIGNGTQPSTQSETEYEIGSYEDELPADILALQGRVFNYECQNVSEVLATESELSNFQTILLETELMRVLDDLSDKLQFTLFAPNNEGLEKIITEGGPSMESQLANRTTMEIILSYHVVPNQVLFAGLTSGSKLETTLKQEEEPLYLTLESLGSLTVIEGIGSSAIVQHMIQACNVTIYIIDSVLVPIDRT
eukprot:TRINITY_DN7767_c2_g1_i1.p1 TRINITY_DN7767_c2_g1~~TRINITY_DN7767_c2_g1_i1.p1  ORF type:complete len:744 (-),score=105.26 TRINITY_DN7767_c2_g1_i1:1637-3868(-)